MRANLLGLVRWLGEVFLAPRLLTPFPLQRRAKQEMASRSGRTL